MKYDYRATNIIAQFIIKMRDDPEYQKNYQKWLKEQERKEKEAFGADGKQMYWVKTGTIDQLLLAADGGEK